MLTHEGSPYANVSPRLLLAPPLPTRAYNTTRPHTTAIPTHPNWNIASCDMIWCKIVSDISWCNIWYHWGNRNPPYMHRSKPNPTIPSSFWGGSLLEPHLGIKSRRQSRETFCILWSLLLLLMQRESPDNFPTTNERAGFTAAPAGPYSYLA